jgi:hypothetical protein
MTYRNADTRIREAFAALRAEIEGVFDPKVARNEADKGFLGGIVIELVDIETDLLAFAKQPASEG